MYSYELYNGDCLDLMENIPDGNVDMVLTDPPYEIANVGGGLIKKREFINEIDDMGMCQSNFNVKNFLNNISHKFNGKEKFNGVFCCSKSQIYHYLTFAIENGLQYGMTIWHKTDPIPLCNNKYLNDVEFIIYIKGNNVKVNGNYKSKSLVYTSTVNKKDKELYGHPTIKPVKLMSKYILNHSDEGGVVFDPFMGSGTTGVACGNLNRKFIGIELDKGYFEIAKSRIEEAYKPKLDTLF